MQIFPKISIVTPSFNQGAYLEQTIRSVLDQNYPNLEFIIMDGGSTDNSKEIIEKYQNKLYYWVSESDNGQVDAISCGFEKSTGDILAYINSDDYYLPGSLKKIASVFMNHFDIQWVTSEKGLFIDENGRALKNISYPRPTLNNMIYLGNSIFQPSTFWRRDLYDRCRGLNPEYSYSFDYDLFLRFAEISEPFIVKGNLSAFRSHNSSKTNTIYKTGLAENEKILKKYWESRNKTTDHFYHLLRGYGYQKITLIMDYLTCGK